MAGRAEKYRCDRKGQRMSSTFENLDAAGAGVAQDIALQHLVEYVGDRRR